MSKIVPHPRFGSEVQPSGWKVSRKVILGSYWRYEMVPEEPLFPESAIPADISRQKYCAFPRGYYVDLLKVCRTCERPFLFYAREQKYWYEELGFYIDADCVRCAECRHREHVEKFHFRRYSGRIHASVLSDGELEELVTDAVFLFEAGKLRNEQTIRRLKNLAVRRLPGREATSAILEVVARIERGGD